MEGCPNPSVKKNKRARSLSACWLEVEEGLPSGAARRLNKITMPAPSPTSHQPPDSKGEPPTAPWTPPHWAHSLVWSSLGQRVCSCIRATSPASPCMWRAAWPLTSCLGSVFHPITPQSGDFPHMRGLTKQSSLINMHRQLSVPSKCAGRNVSRAPMLLL